MFSKNKKYIYVVVVWLLSCLLNSPHALEMEMTTANSTEPKCIWVTTISSKSTRHAVAFLEFLGKYFLPVFITCATFLSLQRTVKKPGNLFLRRNGNAGVRLLRMCTFTAFILAVCWFPNQLYYLLFKYNLTKLNVPWHHATVVLCMFNSCVNPWVYCVTNKTYRRKFAALLRKCFPRVAVNCETTSGTAPFEGSTATDKRSKDNQTLTTEKSGAFCIEKFNEVVSFEEPDDVSCIVHEDSKNSAQKEHEFEGTELGRVYSPTLEETAPK